MTTTAAVLFMLTSLGLSLVGSAARGPGGSVLPEDEPAGASVPAPAPAEQNVPVNPAEEGTDLEETLPDEPDTSGEQPG